MRIIALLLLLGLSANAATYFVDGTNAASSDANPGTALLPWKTISKATTTAVAGDFVTVQPAVYSEFAGVTHSGTAGSPITFSGVRGNDGSWLSIIEPGTLVTNGWTAAPEIGSNVWKQAAWTNRLSELTIGHKRVAFVHDMGDISTEINLTYVGSGLTAGSNLLSLATNVTMTTTDNNNQVKSWDGIEALWGSLTNQGAGTWSIYLRMRDGSSPNGLDVRLVAYNSVAFNLNAQSYVVMSNFLVRDFYLGTYLASSSDNIIVSNYFLGGFQPIPVQAGCDTNTIAFNLLNGNYYGYAVVGAWNASNNPKAYDYIIKGLIYPFSKFIMGIDSTKYNGIALAPYGNGNVIIGNTVTNSIGVGIEVVSESNYATNTIVAGNYVSDHSSVGISIGPGNVGIYIYSNYVGDANSQMRFHDLNWKYGGVYDSNRLVYVYRNKMWLPDGIGNHVFTYSADSGTTNQQSTVWFYHNSISGGLGATADNGAAKNNGGINKFYFINNVMSDAPCISALSGAGTAFWTNSAMVGAFDYNLTTPPPPVDPSGAHTYPAWFGSHCITNPVIVWSSVVGMSFQLPVGSKAIDAAIDTTASFTLAEPNGTNTFSALPQGGDVKVGPAWDMGALEFSGHAIASSLKVINLFLGNPTFH